MENTKVLVVGKDYKQAKRENDGIRVGCFGR